MQKNTTQISKNLRFYLWQTQLERSEWTSWVVARLGVSRIRAESLLRSHLADHELSELEVSMISCELNLSEEDLRFRDLPSENGSIVEQNLKYLFSTLRHGEKKNLAQVLEVDRTTISRWLNGSFEPHKSTLDAITHYFGLPSDIDLRMSVIFLEMDPISLADQRYWLQERIKILPADELRRLFPALQRLLESR